MKETNKQSDKSVAVYCSASDGLPDDWVTAAREVGRAIGRAGATLVYGGVDAGLMREVASAVKSTGLGKVVGVVPTRRASMASPLNDEQISTDSLDERKHAMQQIADVFVVLPGGYGTLDELTGALAYIRFNAVAGKSILLYNPDGLYDPLLAQFDLMIDRGLMAPDCLASVQVCPTVGALTDSLQKLINDL